MWQTCTEPPTRVQVEQIVGMQLINTVCKVSSNNVIDDKSLSFDTL